MRRIIPVLVIALALLALFFRDKWLPAAPGHNAWLGAVDARMTLVGPPSAGRITSIKAIKGADVKAGDVLFAQDDFAARAQLAQAEAAVITAQAQLADLQAGKRPEELAIYDQQTVEAQSNLVLAQQDYARLVSLSQQSISTISQLQAAKNAVDVAQSHIDQINANRTAAALPARANAVAAAQSQAKSAEAARDQAKAHLSDLTITSPSAARVDDVFFAEGEVVGAGQPVISLLTPDALVLRFYVPEAARAKLQPGAEIHFRCDSCTSDLTAKISHVFAQPEYTPPVIYSENARGKLVYQVEAQINGVHPELQPGLPVQVEPVP